MKKCWLYLSQVVRVTEQISDVQIVVLSSMTDFWVTTYMIVEPAGNLMVGKCAVNAPEPSLQPQTYVTVEDTE